MDTSQKIIVTICFSSANVRNYNIADSVMHVQLCLNPLILLLYYFLAGQGNGKLIKRIHASSVWFVRMENNNCTPNTTNYAKERC